MYNIHTYEKCQCHCTSTITYTGQTLQLISTYRHPHLCLCRPQWYKYFQGGRVIYLGLVFFGHLYLYWANECVCNCCWNCQGLWLKYGVPSIGEISGKSRILTTVLTSCAHYSDFQSSAIEITSVCEKGYLAIIPLPIPFDFFKFFLCEKYCWNLLKMQFCQKSMTPT